MRAENGLLVAVIVCRERPADNTSIGAIRHDTRWLDSHKKVIGKAEAVHIYLKGKFELSQLAKFDLKNRDDIVTDVPLISP